MAEAHGLLAHPDSHTGPIHTRAMDLGTRRATVWGELWLFETGTINLKLLGVCLISDHEGASSEGASSAPRAVIWRGPALLRLAPTLQFARVLCQRSSISGETKA